MVPGHIPHLVTSQHACPHRQLLLEWRRPLSCGFPLSPLPWDDVWALPRAGPTRAVIISPLHRLYSWTQSILAPGLTQKYRRVNLETRHDGPPLAELRLTAQHRAHRGPRAAVSEARGPTAGVGPQLWLSSPIDGCVPHWAGLPRALQCSYPHIAPRFTTGLGDNPVSSSTKRAETFCLANAVSSPRSSSLQTMWPCVYPRGPWAGLGDLGLSPHLQRAPECLAADRCL